MLEAPCGHGVQVARRLVQEEHCGLQRKRPRKRHALPLARGQAVKRPLQRLQVHRQERRRLAEAREARGVLRGVGRTPVCALARKVEHARKGGLGGGGERGRAVGDVADGAAPGGKAEGARCGAAVRDGARLYASSGVRARRRRSRRSNRQWLTRPSENCMPAHTAMVPL